jgi:transposase-like protein
MGESGVSQQFGHSFQSWVIYQRLVLRLPYPVIVQVLEDQFNEHIGQSTILSFLSYFFEYYAETDEQIVQAVLHSPFVHVDETQISIQGITQYVWVFTNGTHVFFRLTKTREASIVHEVLAGYAGVLISDFYGGYDAVPCKQQNCRALAGRDDDEKGAVP